MQMLDSLIELGAIVHLASWMSWSTSAVEELRARGIEGVWIYKPFRVEARFKRWEMKFAPSPAFQLQEWHYCSWRMRRWFDRLIRKLHPTTVIINYAAADDLLDHRRHSDVRRLIDMHDLLSVNKRLAVAIGERIERFVRSGNSADLLESGTDRLDAVAPVQAELDIYDKYDYVIAISNAETRLLERSLQHAKVRWIPYSAEPVEIGNTYLGPALFIAANHAGNRIGLILLVTRILPAVRAACPDFRMDVVGDIEKAFVPAEGIRYLGFQPDISRLFAEAAFFVVPGPGVTGQSVKVVEAMAHGLPVVLFAKMAAESPILDGENGLVANDPDMFAAHMIRLWRNRIDCRRLGLAARARLRQVNPLLAGLKEMVR